VSRADQIAIAGTLAAARRVRRGLDARPAQIRALRRLETAAQHAAEDGDASAALAAIEDWRRTARPLLAAAATDKRIDGFTPRTAPEKSTEGCR
jgi:hypothetical protein